jgi:hypothetical protein
MKRVIVTHHGIEHAIDFVAPWLWLGRGGRCDLVLDDERLLREHLQLGRGDPVTFRARGGQCTLDGREVRTGTLPEGALLVLAETWEVRVEQRAPLDQARLARLGTLETDAAREVFADELEASGELDFADYVRVEARFHSQPSDVNRLALQRACSLVPAWQRAQVARAPIELCTRERCPSNWSALPGSPDARWRTCPGCAQTVTFCDSIREARAVDAPLVLEPARPRRPDDLAPAVLR